MDATIQDIADKVGLSTSTVSRALNGSYGVHPRTIAKVQQAAMELGYVPNLGAKQLVTRKSNLIGLFMPELEKEFVREYDVLFASLRKALRLVGKDMLIFSVPVYDYKPNSLSQWVRMRNLEGCIFMQPFGKEHPLMKEALQLKVPAVSMGESVGIHCSLVRSDGCEGGRLIGRYLISQGHRKIGYVNGPVELPISQERYSGFCDALREAGITHDANLLAAGDFSGASGVDAVQLLLEREPELTAICCANDLMAMGVLQELHRIGIAVPGRISVTGYDGAFYTAYTSPPLTTIRHRAGQIGLLAAELLIELLHGGTARTVLMAPELVVRNSVAALNS
ncbi:LacI family DNA-binding transcriptional regulator [Paenibacillus sp. NEAU-GSW1]|nr:LacI family DNA-binding transcriptional regulator [Paenibacillus sp. NEAU-GSW1]MUT64669.1 LacI family DNA-binding transcriptional regulator [Paenibacillus sp. NEAU-GSW1]